VDSIQTSFGSEVRRRRLARCWTQEELAVHSGKHWTYIGAIERGRRNVTLAVVADIARAFGVQPRDLFPPTGREK